MAKVLVGTTPNFNATLYPHQRKLIKTSDDNLFLFANIGGTTATRLRYKKSTDNGDTWGDWVAVYTAFDVLSFDIYNDSNNLYLVVQPFGQYTKFIKLTYSAGSYSIGSTIDIGVGTTTYNVPSITKRSNGDIWVACGTYGSYNVIKTRYSTNDGVDWSDGGDIPPSGTIATYGHKLIPVGSNIWAIVHNGTTLEYYIYTSSWGSAVNIASSAVHNGLNKFSCEKVSDTDIWIAATSYSATPNLRTIKVWHYTGSWDSGTVISTSGNGTGEDIEAVVSIVNGNPAVAWNEESNTNLNYRYYNGASWDSIQTLDNDIRRPTACISDNDWLYVYWLSEAGAPYNIYFEAINLNPTKTKDLTSDAHIKATATKDLTSDAHIIIAKDLTSDAHIKATISKDLTSDAQIVLDKVNKDLTSDAVISITTVKDLTSDAHLVDIYFKDVTNKINFVKGKLYNVTNKFFMAERILSYIFNAISFVKGKIYDVSNDIRTQKRELSNFLNDIRFYKSWQKAGNFGYQSLGKEEIRVYISDVEQTDTVVDSIRINKDINQPQTASFELGRAYDASKPAQEAIVKIKYKDFLLYKGYITSIAPADTPEHILINCQDKFWIDNRANKYFKVGHQVDEKEKYYATIKEAINTEFSWNLDLGNFVPEEINCFAVNSSDALTNLITEAGNYAWFYDEDWNRKLWTAGRGTIVNIQRQAIGTNLGLYQLLEHQFDEDVSGIINKFRVQMGTKILSKGTEGTKSYIITGGYFEAWLTPAWNRSYEKLSYESQDGYGWDNPEFGEEDEYNKVYKYYSITGPSPEEGVDRYPPEIEIHNPGWYYDFPEDVITEGFTIDYANGLVIFSSRLAAWFYKEVTLPNSRLRIERPIFRAPSLKLRLYKETKLTVTSSPSQNPDEEAGNILAFITDKMGDYPVTIIDDLNLSNLTIQEGWTYYDSNGVKHVVPSYDDTEFAEDYAYWQLSKVCDKKIKGTIELTLDAVCFYNIDLAKRINIDGITESPMNIISMDYNLDDFTVKIELENSRYYKRSVSLNRR